MTVIAVLAFIVSVGCVALAVATWREVWPLASGRYVVGDLVTMGSAIFLVAAAVYAVVGLGLLRRKNWARRGAIVLAAMGLYFTIPSISSAVADLRIGAIAIGGLQIMVRVMVLWYLFQEKVATEFLAES